MTLKSVQSEPTPAETVPADIAPAIPRRAHPLRRLGCGVLLVLWFIVLLAPCGLLMMAVNGEIALSQGELPGQQFRMWLIMEADERGVGISSTSTQVTDETHICVQTDGRFVLWQGSADPIHYCECFTRSTAQDEWSFSQMNEGACAAS